MACQSLFSRKIEKNIFNLSPAELIQRAVKVKKSTEILHEMSKAIFWGKYKKNIKSLSRC